MKAFFGSMTGRVFITLFLGILLSAALTQLLADMERQRVLVAQQAAGDEQRDRRLRELTRVYSFENQEIVVSKRPVREVNRAMWGRRWWSARR